VIVRQATIFDLDLVAPLFDAYRQFYQKPADLALARSFLLERFQHSESTIFIAIDEGGAVTIFHRSLFALATLICLSVANAQRLDFSKTIEALEKDGCTTHEPSRVKLCKYNYKVDGKNLEAITFKPEGDGPFPALLLVPGHASTARDWIPNGLTFARNGFAGVAVSQPGYGHSEGPADFVGPKTIKALNEGYRKFQREPFVDAKRMGIVGYSRGGMAASLLAIQIDDVKAVVLGAGVYDFKKAYDEMKIKGIRQNMERETGMTKEAIKQRSSVLEMEKLKCPVLILHGEKDINVPVGQALLLRDRLTELKKDFEIQIFPDQGHGIGPQNLYRYALDFLKRKLSSDTKK
jgi:dipeptidyl aminopeptidase/acylaminoacyl peptidase